MLSTSLASTLSGKLSGAISGAVSGAVDANLRWIAMMLRSDSDAATNYDLWGAPAHLRGADEACTPVINMGYWKDVRPEAPDALHHATSALFQLVGETAELSAEDQVLDVGCGFGTNALYSLRSFGPRSVTGLNVSAFQIDWCRSLPEVARWGERICFRQGSATAMPLPDESFDKLVCIEAAFHFNTRADFFREAWRVLRPGGLLVLADLLPVPPRHAMDRLNLGLLRRSLQIPAENVYDAAHYAAALAAAGFAVERAWSIREHVIGPYTKWAGRDPLRAMSDIRLSQFLSTMTFHAYPWEYFVFKARKPATLAQGR